MSTPLDRTLYLRSLHFNEVNNLRGILCVGFRGPEGHTTLECLDGETETY